jgi:hypothetical protein
MVSAANPYGRNLGFLGRYIDPGINKLIRMDRQNQRQHDNLISFLHGLSPRANYTDRATAASRRSVANLCG